jgi:hypothetical protein
MPYRIPVVFLIAFAILIFCIVMPGIRSQGIRATPMKVAALVFALGVAIYSRSPGCIFLLGPLSLVWFPETWGNYTGYFRGPYIDQKTPPALISIMGWIFLVGFPLLFLWMGKQ